MATIDEDNDIYNGGGGGGEVETGTFLEGDGTAENPLDVKPLPTETSTELNYALMDCLSMAKISGTGNEKPKLMWAKFPIVVESSASEGFTPYAGNIIVAAPAWTGTTNPLSLSTSAPIVINDWKYHQGLQHTAEINMKLGYYDVLKTFHSGTRSFTLFKTSFIQDFANDGKFLKCVREGSHMEIEWVALESSLFEVYIDEDDASNNRNVIYNDILNAVNSGKYVYLVVNRSGEKYVYTIQTCHSNDGIVFSHFNASGIHYCVYNTYLISNSDSYSHASNPLVSTPALIDESQTPVVLSYINFFTLKNWFNKPNDNEIILTYINSNGDKYKLRAVKLTATEISFSVYDVDTARNLSVVVNDQNQYIVIT